VKVSRAIWAICPCIGRDSHWRTATSPGIFIRFFPPIGKLRRKPSWRLTTTSRPIRSSGSISEGPLPTPINMILLSITPVRSGQGSQELSFNWTPTPEERLDAMSGHGFPVGVKRVQENYLKQGEKDLFKYELGVRRQHCAR